VLPLVQIQDDNRYVCAGDVVVVVFVDVVVLVVVVASSCFVTCGGRVVDLSLSVVAVLCVDGCWLLMIAADVIVGSC
jgi:hypothetical protein